MPAKNKTDFNLNNNNATSLIKSLAISIGGGLLIVFGLLLIFAFVLKTKDFPHSYIVPLVIIAIGIGSLFSGLISAKLIRKSGLAFGSLCGIIMALIVILAGLTFSGESMGVISIIKISVSVVCGAVGGLIGINKIK